MFSISLKLCSFMILKPGGGEKSSERKAAFSPPPGPPPLFWPRLSCKKMPAAFSTNWAASPTKESELGVNYFWRKSIFAQFKIFFQRRSPTGIEARQGFAHIESVRVEGDGAPGKGQRANRNALGPSPGFKTVREWPFKRIRKHHESSFGPRSENKDKK